MKINLKKIPIFFLPILCGILGALGGAEGCDKSFRRFGIAACLTGYAFWVTESILTITIMLESIILGLGYGLPSPTDPKPSGLGAFFYNLFNHNEILANIFTRGTIGFLFALCLVSVPVIKGNWKTYIICSVGIVLVNALLSWQSLPVYHLFGKTLLWTETLTWGLISLFAAIIIGG
jgi:hypothetical protein